MTGPQQANSCQEACGFVRKQRPGFESTMCMSCMREITIVTSGMTGGTRSRIRVACGTRYDDRYPFARGLGHTLNTSGPSLTRSSPANIQFPIAFRTSASSSGVLSSLPPTLSPAGVSSYRLSRLHPVRAPESGVLKIALGTVVTVFVFVTANSCEPRSCPCITLGIP
jgi:hypothetical protein